MADLADLAKQLSPGSYAVILALLLVITGLLRRVVHIPDDDYVPREMYDTAVQGETEWKNIAVSTTATVKEQADQLKALTDINERLTEALTKRSR